jgi:hypothetical protein
MSLLISTLLGAAVESATLMGTTVNALFLCFAIGLMDAVPAIISSSIIEQQLEQPIGYEEDEEVPADLAPYVVYQN